MFLSIWICILGQNSLIKQNITHRQNLQNEQNISPNINFDFKENSPFQQGVISETFQRLDKSFFQNPKELGDDHK